MPDLIRTTANLQKGFEQKDELAIAEYAAQLGECYVEQAQGVSEPILKARIYRQAAIAFNSALIRYKKQDKVAEVVDVTHQVMHIKTAILSDAGISFMPEHQHTLNQALAQVQQYRTELHQSHGILLNKIEDYLSTVTPKHINVAAGVQQINALFLENFAMYHYVVEQFTTVLFSVIGDPPCSYAFVAVGSLGKLMPSSKSDLDLMLLLENEAYQDYFKLYAHLLCLCIVDLGETPLVRIKTPEMSWMYQFCEQDKEGFSIDVGGLPIDYGPYQLLGRPESILFILDKIKTEYFSPIDTALYCPRLLTGSPLLLEEFQILNQKRLKSDVDVASFKEFTSCLEEFNSITLDEEMYMKHEWLRQFVESLVSLARLYDIPTANPCDIISSLMSQQIITPELANDLNELYFLIAYFILRNYQFHNAQVQQILLKSQILPHNEIIKVSSGHNIKTAKGFFRHEVWVRKMPAPSERYYLLRNERVIAQDMPWIHHLLYLQSGFRHLLHYFLAKKYETIRILPSLAIDPTLLFDFAAREHHLNKNSINRIKHNTNYLYLHLIDYFKALNCQTYIANQESNSVCLFFSSGSALISIALKLFRLDAAKHIVDHMMVTFQELDKSELHDFIKQLKIIDKRLPTLYAQFLFFMARVLLFDTVPNQMHSPATLQQAETYIEMAKNIRAIIDKNLPYGVFDDTDNDGSDSILTSLYGPNLLRIASGKKEQLMDALESYRSALGRDEITDVACYSKIIKIRFRLYDLASIEEKESLLYIIEQECQLALTCARAIESSITAVFYNALGTLFCHRGQLYGAVAMFKESCEIERSFNRSEGTTLQEATHALETLYPQL